MLNILEQAGNWSDNWKYTFLIVALIAIMIGTFLTISKIIKSNNDSGKKRIKSMYNESETVIKKKKSK